MTLGKALALSGPLEKITLKVPTCKMHELLKGLSVSSEAGVRWAGRCALMSLRKPLPTSSSQIPHLGNEEKASPQQAQGTRAHLPGAAGQWPKHRQTPHANPRAQAGCQPQPRATKACTEVSLCRPFPGREGSRMGGEPRADPALGVGVETC